jgi:hypothetical protein
MFGMKLMRLRDVDRLDLDVGAKLFDRSEGARVEAFANRWRASLRGSAATTSGIRSSRTQVGNMMVNARPSPATTRRNLRFKPSGLISDQSPAWARVRGKYRS